MMVSWDCFLLNALAVLVDHYDGFLGLLWAVVKLFFWSAFWVVAVATVLIQIVGQ